MMDLKATVDIQIAENYLELLTLDLQHIYALSNLPLHHRNPFDRLLIAQSQVEKITLATVERTFELYNVDRFY